MTEIPKEKRLELAIKAFHKGQFPSKTACAKAFDVPPRTLMTRLNGTVSRQHTIANCRKLSNTEEESLKNWILDMDKRGLPLQVSNVRHLAQLLLSARSKPSKDISISEKWVSRFIQRHPELKSKYTRQYDYQRAKCEDPELIKGWFNRVQETMCNGLGPKGTSNHKWFSIEAIHKSVPKSGDRRSPDHEYIVGITA